MHMACAEDQQANFKHFCRICKKGFMCGRALGGHMRAHGIGDESGSLDDEDPTSDSEDKQGNKRMYSLRTNPNRLKSCRICENCGKEFFSWKSFLEHGKCGSDDAESLVSSPESRPDDDDDDEGYHDDDAHRDHYGRGWSKRKRTLRAKVGDFDSICHSTNNEDLVLAKCLMALSNSKADPVGLEPNDTMFTTTSFLSTFTRPPPPLDKAKGVATTTPKGMFECKACKKVFNSHQALGGHRASHKNVKGCYAARNDQYDESQGDDDVITHDEFFPSPKPISTYQFDQGPSTAPVPLVGAARRKSKVHKCTICNRIFASGQALGGHKRCHWLTSNSSDTSSLAKFNFHEHIEQLHQRALALPSQILNKSKTLDLNLPASIDGLRRDPQNPLSFEMSTEINLHSWNIVDQENGDKHQYDINNQNMSTIDQDDHRNPSNHEKSVATMENVDDEADSKVKLAKLGELKDMNNISGSSSSWLQVGIGSTTGVDSNP